MRLLDAKVADTRQLADVRGFPRPIAERYGEHVLTMLADAEPFDMSRLKRGRPRDETPEDRMRIDGLVAVATCICLGRHVAPALAFNRKKIEAFHWSAADGDESPGDVLGPGWRVELLGRPLERFLRGESPIELSWRDGRPYVET